MDEDEIFRRLAERIGLNLSSTAEFNNRELQQRWDIAQLNERGASDRARIGAGASVRGAQIGANASMRNARLASETQRYGIDTEAQTARERLGLDTELGRGQLGLSTLELPTKYRGPADYFQQSDLLHGLSQRQDVPVFVQSLLDSTNMRGAGSAPGGAPAGFNLQGAVNALTGGGGQLGGTAGGGATAGQNGTALAAIRQLGSRGFQSLAPGALERLNPSELGALQSGLEYSADGGPAWSWEDLLSQHSRSRIGQGSAFQA